MWKYTALLSRSDVYELGVCVCVCVCVCVSSDVDGALAKVQWVQGGGQGCVEVRAAEPQAVHRAARWLWAQLEELQNKHDMKSHYNNITFIVSHFDQLMKINLTESELP